MDCPPYGLLCFTITSHACAVTRFSFFFPFTRSARLLCISGNDLVFHDPGFSKPTRNPCFLSFPFFRLSLSLPDFLARVSAADSVLIFVLPSPAIQPRSQRWENR